MREKVRQVILKYLPQASPCPSFDIEKPKLKLHGDLSTNVAMVLSRVEKRPPQVIARDLAVKLQKEESLFEKVEVAGAGFINFTLLRSIWQKSLEEIDRQGDSFGHTTEAKGVRALVEFISGNPTGPLHIGNARGGPLGDVIASLLATRGYSVTREYYVNDVGGQIDQIGAGILFEYKKLIGLNPGSEPPQYRGDTIIAIARRAHDELQSTLAGLEEKETVRKLAQFGLKILLDQIRDSCEAMGVHFDSWVYEGEILAQETEGVLSQLISRGATLEKDGALWFAARNEFLEDRESVLKRSDGRPTYFANDLAYQARRYRIGFTRMINVWGANHHGHLPRMQAGLLALGLDTEKTETVFYQTVRLKQGSSVLKMSKREGRVLTVDEVIQEVGRDAFRFFLLMRAGESHLDFDLELAKRQSQENPVYYVQYAHARLASLFRRAAEQKIQLVPHPLLERLTRSEEIDLIRILHEYPEEIRRATQDLEPHRIPFYLLELAKAFQAYYAKAKQDPDYRILGGDIDTIQAKLYLCKLLKRTISSGLRLIGVSSPEVMERDGVSEGS